MSERPIIGYYGCSCHNFATVSEWKLAYNQKLAVGDKVRHRCKGTEGIIDSIDSEEWRFVIVKYGPLQRDLHLEHVENLIKL